MRWIRNILPIAICVLIPTAGQAGELLDAKVSFGTGYTAHPLGFSDDEEAAYIFQSLVLSVVLPDSVPTWRIVYEGNGYQFSNGVELNQMHHALGMERLGSLKSGSASTRLGVQIAGRLHEDDRYQPYDYRQASAYAATKGYPRNGVLLRGHVDTKYRRYGDLPEESYLESNARLELQRFLPSSTTLGLQVGWGAKWYTDSAAEEVWETGGTPVTSQVRLRLNAAQGLGARVSVRAAGSVRISLADFPYIVREDLYDSPLLDWYASSGWRAESVVRALVPWQTWFEVGSAYGARDYGDLRFPGVSGPASRSDDILDVFCSLERAFDVNDRNRMLVEVGGRWTRQESDLETYDLSGPNLSTSLSWLW
ncbi:hypothetical protein K8I85_10940 [bacterium]|nr:hypothetical protein [bacterium]